MLRNPASTSRRSDTRLGKVAIGLYLGKSDVTSSFGSAGSMVVLMIWVYYASQIFLLGAEFTRIYADKFGSRRAVAKERRSSQSRTGRRKGDRYMPGEPTPA